MGLEFERLTTQTCHDPKLGMYLLSVRADGMWGPWKMLSKKGETGVWWRAELQPAYHVFKTAQHVVGGAAGGVGSLLKKIKR